MRVYARYLLRRARALARSQRSLSRKKTGPPTGASRGQGYGPAPQGAGSWTRAGPADHRPDHRRPRCHRSGRPRGSGHGPDQHGEVGARNCDAPVPVQALTNEAVEARRPFTVRGAPGVARAQDVRADMAKSGRVAAVPAPGPVRRHGRRSGGRGLSLRVILVAALLALVGAGLLVSGVAATSQLAGFLQVNLTPHRFPSSVGVDRRDSESTKEQQAAVAYRNSSSSDCCVALFSRCDCVRLSPGRLRRAGRPVWVSRRGPFAIVAPGEWEGPLRGLRPH